MKRGWASVPIADSRLHRDEAVTYLGASSPPESPARASSLQHGLLRASFVPPRPIRQLRDLTRQRTQPIRHRATMANRLQKALGDANIKLAGVATEILGVSGRAMIRALIAGDRTRCV